MAGLAAVAAWCAGRGFVLWLMTEPYRWATGDVDYFRISLDAVPRAGLAHVLVEYPFPAVGVLAAPAWLAHVAGQPDGYRSAFAALLLVVDALFTVGLARARRPGALWCWLLAVPLLGPVAYSRFDLVPGVLVGAAVLAVPRYPRLAGAFAAFATGVKLWPAMLLPALVAVARRRGGVVAVLAVVGAVLAGGTLLIGGWDRLVSPLDYQFNRGLEIEAVAATPAILAWWHDPATWSIGYAHSLSYEVTGPGVGFLLQLTTVVTLLFVVGLLAMWLTAWRRRELVRVDAFVWTALAAVTGFMATGKVLSPQYFLWLLPLTAAGLAVIEVRRRSLLAFGVVLLVATGLTQLVFPVLFGGLTLRDHHVDLVVPVLLVRNVLLVVLFGWAVRESWWRLSAEGRWPASRPRGARTRPGSGRSASASAVSRSPEPRRGRRPPRRSRRRGRRRAERPGS